MNRDRQRIASCLNCQTSLNLAAACRSTGCSFSMVKKVHHDLLFQGQVERFRYNNLKDAQELVPFDETIKSVAGTYLTITDIKRKHRTFSKKWIGRALRATGMRYLRMARKRKVDTTIKPNPRDVFEVVSHLAQAIMCPQAEVYYIDEMHFPLFQTSEKYWTKPDQLGEMVYNRRPALEGKLSAIAMCSLEKFIAVQIYTKDVTAMDFLYFIQEAMLKVGQTAQGRTVTILADNASWHTTDTVLQTEAGKILYFNVARLYQANAIETSFSFVRSDFRKRMTVGTLEEEAYLVLDAFFREENIERFKGVARNHLRSLIKLLEIACPTKRMDFFEQ